MTRILTRSFKPTESLFVKVKKIYKRISINDGGTSNMFTFWGGTSDFNLGGGGGG